MTWSCDPVCVCVCVRDRTVCVCVWDRTEKEMLKRKSMKNDHFFSFSFCLSFIKLLPRATSIHINQRRLI